MASKIWISSWRGSPTNKVAPTENEAIGYGFEKHGPLATCMTNSRPRIFAKTCQRALLEITAVRVERLNAISDADALAEGCSSDSMLSGDCLASVYARLWESINGHGSWDANPWVWVIEFRRLLP